MDSVFDDDSHRVCIDFLFPVLESTIKKEKISSQKNMRGTLVVLLSIACLNPHPIK
jgi:hypothetical protein